MASWNYDDEEINGVIDSNIKDSPPNPPGVNTASTIRSMLKLYWAVIRNQVSAAVNYVDLHITTALATIELQLGSTQTEISGQLSSTLSEVEERVVAGETLAQSVFDTFSLADVLGTYNASTGVATRKQAGTTFTPVTVANEATGKCFDIIVAGTVDIFGTGPTLVAVGGRIVSRGTKWDYIPPADTGYAKSVANEVLLYQKFNEVFNPLPIDGYRYSAKNNGAGKVQPAFAFDLSAIAYGGTATTAKFSAKILVSGNVVNIARAYMFFNANSTVISNVGNQLNASGASPITNGVTLNYECSYALNIAKQNYAHVLIDIIGAGSSDLLDVLVYDVKFEILATQAAKIGGTALNSPNVTDTFTTQTLLTQPAATKTYSDSNKNTAVTEAKNYTDSVITLLKSQPVLDGAVIKDIGNTTNQHLQFAMAFDITPLTYISGTVMNVKLKLLAKNNVVSIDKVASYINDFGTILNAGGPGGSSTTVRPVTNGTLFELDIFINVGQNTKYNFAHIYIDLVLADPAILTEIFVYDGALTIASISATKIPSFALFRGQPGNSLTPKNYLDSYLTNRGDLDSKLSSYALSTSIVHSKLRGKRILFAGDSIPAGQGVTSAQRFPNLIATKHGMILTNMAIAGTSISGTNPNALVNLISTFPTDVDYFIWMMGTNDVNNGVPMGTDGDMTNTTFKGSLNLVFQWMLEHYPIAKLGFITPFRFQSTMVETYVNVMEERGYFWGVRGFNSLNGPLNPQNLIQKTVTMQDSKHPLPIGHAMFADATETWMESL